MFRKFVRKVRKFLITISIIYAIAYIAVVKLIPPDPYIRLVQPDKYDQYEAAEEITHVNKYIFQSMFEQETESGKKLGDYLVINQVDNNGEKYLYLLCGNLEMNPLKIKGGFAGEVGLFQFLTETWWRFKRDGNSDGRYSPFEMPDSLLSVAAVLHYYGYMENEWEAVRRFNGNDDKSYRYRDEVKARAIELGYKPRTWNYVNIASTSH